MSSLFQPATRSPPAAAAAVSRRSSIFARGSAAVLAEFHLKLGDVVAQVIRFEGELGFRQIQVLGALSKELLRTTVENIVERSNGLVCGLGGELLCPGLGFLDTHTQHDLGA